MLLHQLTLADSAANLAFDEALLETADAAWATSNERAPESLRLWEPQSPIVVLGRSSPIKQEVNLGYCLDRQIPVLRRCSGGATIVSGPGCLMYAVILRYAERPELRMLDKAHRFVMSQMRSAIASLGIEVEIQGTSDLTIRGKKFSGNSLRCRRYGFLYHGTMICDFDLSLVSRCLGSPCRQPDYRAGRSHDEFLTRLPVSSAELGAAIAQHWKAKESATCWLAAQTNELTQKLAREKYSNREWTEAV